MIFRISPAVVCAAFLSTYAVTLLPAANAQQADTGTAVDAQPVPVPPAPVMPPAPPAAPTAPSTTTRTTTTTTQTTVPALPPAPVAIPSIAPALPSVAIENRDARTLHPTLIPTDMGLETSLHEGRQFGKTSKDLIDLLSSNRSAFDYRRGGMLGEMRRETGVVYWITPTVAARWRGFTEQRQFADANTRTADFETSRNEVIAPQRTLTFLVEIGNLVPAPKGNGSVLPADPAFAAAKISGTRFVLSDDRDNNYQAISGPDTQKLLTRQQFYESIAPSPDRLGQRDTSTPANDAANEKNRLVKLRPAYNDLAAFYVVKFDAFNSDGTARVNRDTKSVTLHVITPEGDKYAYFALNKIP